ncbi:hypothetical protein P4S72_03115 [Vibrio sp. PP-XX7]
MLPALAQEAPRTAFVHLFEWRWPDIATECETFLGPKGFAAVGVSSPPKKSIDNARMVVTLPADQLQF